MNDSELFFYSDDGGSKQIKTYLLIDYITFVIISTPH